MLIETMFHSYAKRSFRIRDLNNTLTPKQATTICLD